MLAILNALNAHNLPLFQPILMILLPKFFVHRALSEHTIIRVVVLFKSLKCYGADLVLTDVPEDTHKLMSFNAQPKSY